jgi:Cu+-exporting ATPase
MATGSAAKNGVLFRDAAVLERLPEVAIVVVDKTGTLTTGHAEIVTVVALGKALSSDALLALVASLEQSSEHPFAPVVIAGAAARNLPLTAAEDFIATPGQGVSGRVQGKKIFVGSAEFLQAQGIDTSAIKECSALQQSEGRSTLLVGIEGKAAGFIAIADPLKETSRAAVENLRAQGIRVMMVTGDQRTTAEAVARTLGVSEVRAGVSPAGKAELVRELQALGLVVAAAGDGINDAPALAQADVGIAMGTGTDIAMASAGVTLVHGDLHGILFARKIAVKTRTIMRQNLFLAFIYNVVSVPIAAGVLYPHWGLLLSPMLAAAAMSLSSVSVIFNALRLRQRS